MEIKEIFIKNFRNIGEEGATIKLSPITIFTGCNSAGKSTAAKAITLLETYMSDIKDSNFNLIETPLDFSKIEKLGSFDSVLNKAAKANGQNEFTIGYSFASAIFVADIHVRLTFGKKDADSLNYGWLVELSILIDSTELLSIRIEDGYYVLDIKDQNKFIEYARCYKVSQISHLWKECQYEEYYGEKTDLRISYSERLARMKMRALMPDILNIKNALIANGLIRENSPLTHAEVDTNIALNLSIIAEAIEGSLSFNTIDTYIYDFEKSKGTRLSDEDVDSIINNIINNDANFNNLRAAIANATDTQVEADLRKLYQKTKEDYEKDMRSYISSEYSTIGEFVRETKDAATIANFVEHFNHTNLQEACLMNRLQLFNVVSNQLIKSISLPLNYILKLALDNFCGKVGYARTSTVEVERLYQLDSTDSFVNQWKRFNNLKSSAQPHASFKCGDFMKKWLQELNICDNIVIDNREGFLQIKLAPEGRLLADYGYGVTKLVALLLNIEIAISKAKESFIYPECYGFDEPVTIPYRLIIEEPEAHLHPCFQSRLADIFLDAIKLGVRFIIETHSEYLVRRTQVLVSQMNLTEENIDNNTKFRVYYFPTNGTLFDMKYQTNGYFKEPFGTGFLDEAGKWTRELMRSKSNRR